jgi:ABC-type uncharacterized transport system auxiliary subunit
MSKNLFLLIFIFSLSGCFGGGAEVPRDNFYRLSEVDSAPKLSSPFKVIAVAAFRSDDLHRERAILYSKMDKPLSINRYYYHHWTQAPNELIQEHLIDYLRKAEYSPIVVRYGEVVKIDAKLSGYIKRFERILDSGDVKVSVQLELHLDTLGDVRKHFQHTYNIEQVTADTSMNSTVVTMSRVLEKIYQQFLNDISGLDFTRK